jgi:hypothetical protein
VPCACRDDDRHVGFDRRIAAVDRDDTRPLFDAEELVDRLVNFFADVSPGSSDMSTNCMCGPV